LEDDIDTHELSAILWKNKIASVEELQEKVCKKMTSRCKGGKKALSAQRKRQDYPFEEMDQKDLEVLYLY
jgi:hypothetical protein